MNSDKGFLISFVLNVLTFLLVLAGTIIMMTIGSGALADNSLSVFKYFTFQSNIFMGIVALVYAIFQLLVLLKKRENIPHVLHVFDHVGTAAVSLTFVIVILFLAPGYGFRLMYNNANLFFHALAPLSAMINFMFFAKECRISFKETFIAIIPSFLYGVVYFSIVASMNAYGDRTIDFYGFGALGTFTEIKGPLIGALNFVLIMGIAYGFGLVLYFINGLMRKKR